MSINVYWTVLEKEWMGARQPQPVIKEFYERRLHSEDGKQSFHRCPFTHEHLVNRFSLHSLYDYSFSINENKTSVYSDMYDQKFFEKHVLIRSIEKKFFSFNQSYVFFTDEKTLPASFPEFPYLEDNNITQRCIPFTGTIDVGRYFRPMDLSFFLKDSHNEFVIEKDEVFGYIKFYTEEKIKLKQFYPSEQFYKYLDDQSNMNNAKNKKFLSTDFFYDNFKLKNKILKDIRENLL